jgi:ATP-dependent DNA helicase RecQ
MPIVSFFDLETPPGKDIIDDIGCIRSDEGNFHSRSFQDFLNFIKDSDFICGHNIFKHDLKYLQKYKGDPNFGIHNAIDTLYISPLLFPKRPYHRLLKDDKLDEDEKNNPLLDSKKAKELFDEEVSAFLHLPNELKLLYYNLTGTEKEFRNFFRYINYQNAVDDEQLAAYILSFFPNQICSTAPLHELIKSVPVALAYALALIHAADPYSITPPWVLHNYPEVQRVLFLLRSKPCNTGCSYCNEFLDPKKALKKYFGYDDFRKYADEPLQEKAVNAAIQQKSILAVFPTGGGKSITFQVPALMAGENEKALTVVISPLQSLMKDQVDNLEKNGITAAVTINGMLDPIDRQLSIQRVEGEAQDKALANILYLSPESLRSVTIERLLLKRKIARFVIDEAHCFSSWGQDFRVDYLYIGDFISNLQKQKGLEDKIPVSCFTATAKQKVIEDIRDYFRNKLGLELELFSSAAGRTNLHYKVYNEEDANAKYAELRRLLEMNTCPTIIYVSRTKKAIEIATQLTADGFQARAFHGKMDKDEKKANMDAFINGKVDIMVATSAFGMGVDKNNVGMVIHYQISDSLENYVQEAGRAGRDEKIQADCYVLFNEDDLDKHFQLLNQTKLDVKEINQVWKAIKELTKTRANLSYSALEIARKAGWDENIRDIETRITTAVAALEDSGYVKRGRNKSSVFASSIKSKNAQEAIQKIENSVIIPPPLKQNAGRIIKKLFSSKSKSLTTEETAESRIDYISDQLAIRKKEVLEIIELLKQENILDNFKDITAYIGSRDSSRSIGQVERYCQLEKSILTQIEEQQSVYNVKELKQQSEASGCKEVNVDKIYTVLNFWAIKDWIKKERGKHSKNHLVVKLSQAKDTLVEKMEKRHLISRMIIEYLYQRAGKLSTNNNAEEKLVEFSIEELRLIVQKEPGLFKIELSHEDIEDSLLFLSRTEALKIEGGFLVTYNRLSIERLVQDNKIQYKNEDYQKLDQFYKNKVQQIHIVGEYARKMIENYNDALQFVDDYFKLNYSSFLRKYFRGRQEDLNRKMTPEKFRRLFGSLSPAQLEIINDKDSNKILVAAGPGSGKTRVLVHKLASVLLTEDVKPEQLLMLTFSRAAATEFKRRLLDLIGASAHYVDIKTFHSFCFDICGEVGDLEHAKDILPITCDRIEKGDVQQSMITRTVLVVDEAQDISAEEYRLLKLLMQKNDDIRVILVGDDDQNIYEFRKSSSRFMIEFLKNNEKAKKYELVVNYRSRENIVEFSNNWVSKIQNRLKDFPIVSDNKYNGIIHITEYNSGNLVVPVVNAVLNAELTGTITVLTRTNEEAEEITGLLINKGRQARLIQSHDGFPLHKLKELRYFTDLVDKEKKATVVSEETWQEALQQLKKEFSASDKLPWCEVIIRHFAEINKKVKYKSDWKNFLEESKFEDFVEISGETIYVSTIHKAKGKEFDNVFLMQNGFHPQTDEEKRLFYVGCTRAKSRLEIHYNGDYLKSTKANDLAYKTDNLLYPEPEFIARNLTLNDVYLGYFSYVQHRLNTIRSGSGLAIGDDGLYNLDGKRVIQFSKPFANQIEKWKGKGYQLKNAKNNFTVYWWDKEKEKEVEVLLPEVRLSRVESG